MKKIKSAEEYLEDIFNPDKSLPCDREELQMSITLNPQLKYFEEAIKQAQIDAIEATVERCAEEATVKSDSGVSRNNKFVCEVVVNKQSILNVADKMKGELNNVD